MRRVTAARAREYDDRGCFVLEDALDCPTVERVRDAIDPLDAETLALLRTQDEGRFPVSDAKTSWAPVLDSPGGPAGGDGGEAP